MRNFKKKLCNFSTGLLQDTVMIEFDRVISFRLLPEYKLHGETKSKFDLKMQPVISP